MPDLPEHPLTFAIAQLHVAWQRPSDLDDAVVQERHARLECNARSGAINIGYGLVGHIDYCAEELHLPQGRSKLEQELVILIDENEGQA
jgi:hypothetical protein